MPRIERKQKKCKSLPDHPSECFNPILPACLCLNLSNAVSRRCLLTFKPKFLQMDGLSAEPLRML